MWGLGCTSANGVMSGVQTESECQPMRWHGHQTASKPSASLRCASETARLAGGMSWPGTPIWMSMAGGHLAGAELAAAHAVRVDDLADEAHLLGGRLGCGGHVAGRQHRPEAGGLQHLLGCHPRVHGLQPHVLGVRLEIQHAEVRHNEFGATAEPQTLALVAPAQIAGAGDEVHLGHEGAGVVLGFQ